jgi:hypothetical protein
MTRDSTPWAQERRNGYLRQKLSISRPRSPDKALSVCPRCHHRPPNTPLSFPPESSASQLRSSFGILRSALLHREPPDRLASFRLQPILGNRWLSLVKVLPAKRSHVFLWCAKYARLYICCGSRDIDQGPTIDTTKDISWWPGRRTRSARAHAGRTSSWIPESLAIPEAVISASTRGSIGIAVETQGAAEAKYQV